MKRLLTLVVLCTTLTVGFAQDVKKQLRNHIEYLTSDELAGRKAGSAGAEAAATYIESKFNSEMGLQTHSHHFSIALEDGSFCNIVGSIKGIESDKYIVIGAHYDHLGTKRGKIYHGADDNASGTAALLEVARSFTRRNFKPRHTLLFVAFDAEEMGLYGSKAYVERYGLNNEKVKVMINMDMVGWLKDGQLNIEGTGTLNGSDAILDRLAGKHSIAINKKNFETSRLTGTDTEAFAQAGIPTLSLNTGMKSPYHTPEDTADQIDYDGLAKITDFVSDLVVAIDTNEQVAASGKVARKHSYNGLEVALAFSTGSTHQHIPNVAIDGRPDDCWQLGVAAQYSFRHVALRGSLLYDHRKALTPHDLNDIYKGPATTLGLKSVTVPVDILLKTKGKSCLYIGAGLYRSWIFESRLNKKKIDMASRGIDSNEYGWHWTAGWRLADFYVEITDRYSLTPLSQGGMMPTVYNRSTLCSMGLYF